jgi:hypothetical protein
MSGAENSWLLLASIYHTLLFIGMGGAVSDRMDYWYPLICTCGEEFAANEGLQGIDSEIQAIFNSCSEQLTLDNFFDENFDRYLATYGKSYETREEYDTHLAAFRATSNVIWDHNSLFEDGEATSGMSYNKYSDYT